MSQVNHGLLLLDQKIALLPCGKAREVCASESKSPETLSERLSVAGVLCSGKFVPGDAVSIIVPNHDVCFLGLPWSDEFVRHGTADAQANLQFISIWGAKSSHLNRVMDDAPYGSGRLLMGIDQHDLDMIQAWSNEQGVRLVSVQPLLLAVWQWARVRIAENNHLFALVEAGTLCLVLVRNGVIQNVLSMVWQGDWIGSLEMLCKRARLRGELRHDDGPLYVLTLLDDASQQSLPTTNSWMRLHSGDWFDFASQMLAIKPGALDFIPQKPRLEGWRLRVLLAAILLLALAGYFLWQGKIEVLAREDASSRLQNRESIVVAPRPRIASGDLDKRIIAASQLIRQLNIPTASLLKAVSPLKKEHVALLALELNPARRLGGSAAIKIMAEGLNAEEMAAYIARLNREGFFDSVYLVHHEIVSAAEARSYRFSLEAQWKE